MEFVSFGRMAIEPGKEQAFEEACRSAGLKAVLLKDGIFDVGYEKPSLLDPAQLKQKAGLIGLKYSAL